MSSDESIKEKLIKNHPAWGKRYNENEYLSNRAAIKRLIAEKRFESEYSVALEKERERLQQQIHELELRNRELEITLGEAREKEKVILILSLLIAVLTGIGLNHYALKVHRLHLD